MIYSRYRRNNEGRIVSYRTLNEEELVKMLDEPTIINDSENNCSQVAICFTLKT